MRALIDVVRPDPNVKAVVLYSPGDVVEFITGAVVGRYYDSLSMEGALNPQPLLDYEMNCQPLTHLHGARLRPHVGNQLGFKMMK